MGLFIKFIEGLRRRSNKTAIAYESIIGLWSRTVGQTDPDKALDVARQDPYGVLDDWVSYCHKTGKSPKSIRTYFSAVKAFIEYGDIDLSPAKLRKITRTLPQNGSISTDRIPTFDEVRKVLFRCDLKSKAVFTMLLSSGMRLGELCSLKVGSVDLQASPVRVHLNAQNTKSRHGRTVFISTEAASILKDYLGERAKNTSEYIFSQDHGITPDSTKTIYSMLRRRFKAAGLLYKMDPNSRTNALHPHVCRKFFFTHCLASNVDRGLVEKWMGHKYQLDSSYLRMDEQKISEEYIKSMPKLTFLSGNANGETSDKLSELEEELGRTRQELAKAVVEKDVLKDKLTEFTGRQERFEHRMETLAENRTQNVKGMVTAEFQALWEQVERRILSELRPTGQIQVPPIPSPNSEQSTAAH